ncbi:hypothetical protein DCCM_3968 [Desulfocucumis palustris]|uniref:Uncharacterized protein n=1 Tax=Desulfocucumis palustris TaxID=1898651 RepID=A0A2L2XF25_9FIRM|nr:hypothetical protein DCCM_3968 [Desulfocucumis palustris]
MPYRVKQAERIRRGIIGTKSEPGINPCDGPDSFGCPPSFLPMLGDDFLR